MLTVPSSVTSPFCHVGCAEVSVVDVVVSLSLTEDEAVVASVEVVVVSIAVVVVSVAVVTSVVVAGVGVGVVPFR